MQLFFPICSSTIQAVDHVASCSDDLARKGSLQPLSLGVLERSAGMAKVLNGLASHHYVVMTPVVQECVSQVTVVSGSLRPARLESKVAW
jgi:hypothetical protein